MTFVHAGKKMSYLTFNNSVTLVIQYAIILKVLCKNTNNRFHPTEEPIIQTGI